MRIPLVAILALVTLNAIIDIFIYRKLKKSNKECLKKSHVVFSVILYFCLGYIYFTSDLNISNKDMVVLMWMIFVHISIYVPKYVYVLLDVFSLIPHFWKGKPWKWIAKTGTALSIIILSVLWWSALVTPRNFVVNQVNIESPNLPQSFDGYTIAQFSDLHSGTYGKRTSIMENMVQEINRLNPDLIIFTGDIVNRNSSELKPFLTTLNQLKSRDGIISILGNHDYGDYMHWKKPEDKKKDFEQMISLQRDSLNWTLLLNQHMFLHNGNDSIMIIGTENWSDNKFPSYCNFAISYPKENKSYKILLTHNPKHWEEEVVNKTDIDLTLSGHTHAMQSMIQIGSMKISPSSLRYRHWGGLYQENGQYLYVNIGVGEVGLPIRVGANPEITLFTLRKKNG